MERLTLIALVASLLAAAPAVASPRYGEAVLVADDVNGDDVADLIISDPGENGGEGLLYVFYGPIAQNPLPDPANADEVLSFPLLSLFDTGTRLKQACDLTGDGICDLWVEALVRRADGSYDPRVFSVDPTNGDVLADFLGGTGVPDYWDHLETASGTYDAFWAALASPGSDSGSGSSGGSSSSSGSGWGAKGFEMTKIAVELFHPNPITWAERVGKFAGISSAAASGARRLYPMPEDPTDQEIAEVQWQRNAARHAIWQGWLSMEFGIDVAAAIANIHEEDAEDELDSWIDQYNNQVARDIFLECAADGFCDLGELLRRILEGLRNNRFITNPCDPRVPPDLIEDSDIECGGMSGTAGEGDINTDGAIDGHDMIELIDAIGTRSWLADLDWSGEVGPEDASILLDILARQ